MSGMTQTTEKQFNPFNNEFECSICYEYCYGDKQDCKTCSGAICNECKKGLNGNDALRNKCVICRSPLEFAYQYEISKKYLKNLAFLSQEQRKRITNITAFFRHEREDNTEIQMSELTWYFTNVLPLHPKDNGRKIFESGHRVVHETLFPKSKRGYFSSKNRDPLKWKVANSHRILCYHTNTGILQWTNKTAVIHKVNDKSVRLVKGYNLPDDNLSGVAYDSIDNNKRYKKAFHSRKFNPFEMLGCDMGSSIIIYQSHERGYIYFINKLL